MSDTIININIGSVEIETVEQLTNRLRGTALGNVLGIKLENSATGNENDVLVIFSCYEDTPDFFLFNSRDELGKLAISCDKVAINDGEGEYSEEQIEFVEDLRNSAYRFKNSKEATYTVVEDVSGTFKYVIRCGFHP